MALYSPSPRVYLYKNPKNIDLDKRLNDRMWEPLLQNHYIIVVYKCDALVNTYNYTTMLYFENEQAHACIWPYSAAWAVIG